MNKGKRKAIFLIFVKKAIVEISGYIAELLGEQDYVVLPGVGAFVSAYRAAHIPEGGTTVEPPSREVTFNHGMRMNDGFLTGYITSKTGASLQEARKLVSSYADDILYRLDRDGHVLLEKMGTLQKQKGEITFTPLEELNRLPGAYGLVAVSLEAATPVAEPPENVDVTSEPENSGSAMDTSVAESPNPTVAPSATELPTSPPSPPFPGKERKKDPERLPLPGIRRSLKPLLVVVPLLLAIAALLFTFLPHHKNGQESLPPGNHQNSTVTSGNPTPTMAPGTGESTEGSPVPAPAEVSSADSSAASGPGSSAPDSAGTTSVTPASPLVIPAVSSSDTPQNTWYVVAGSFQSQKNADKFARELTHKGYQPFSLGKVGNYYFIATDSFRTESEAFRAVNQYNTLHPGSEAWVFLPRKKKQRPPQ